MKTRELKEACDLRADIVAVVRACGCELIPAGREFKAICPFHDDHKPSMYVVPEKQMYHCFSCAAGGDQYSFVEAYEGRTEFADVVRRVAEILGVQTDGTAVKPKGEREVRRVEEAPVEKMKAREILDEWRWYREHAYDATDWADRLGIDPMAMELTQMVAAPFRHNQAKRVLVAPMRDAEGRLVSLRFRDFETKKRWSLDRKERIGGKLVKTGATDAGLMSYEAAWDEDASLVGCRDLIIEGETDLLGAITILLRSFDPDPLEWPLRVIALPGVLACHEMLLEMRHAPVVVTFFDLDGAGFRSAFDHRRSRRVVAEDGSVTHEPNLEVPKDPGLISKLATKGFTARACFPPESADGTKYDLRDMARDGWDWERFSDHLLLNSTGDAHGRRLRKRA